MKNEKVPDPFYGLENEAIIDIADSGREYYTFWFFTTFQSKLVCDMLTCKNCRLMLYIYIYTHLLPLFTYDTVIPLWVILPVKLIIA